MSSRIAAFAFGLLCASIAGAQTHDSEHMASMLHGDFAAVVSNLPGEPGQGAFAAISEIVTMLAADPETDWSLVDIDALRDHLVDMDKLVTDSIVTSRPIENGLEMTILRDTFGGQAASRMVPAHGPVLSAEVGWASEVQFTDDTIIWTVTADSGQDVMRIQALGFYGIMATGDHHSEHHLAMATGQMVH